MYVTYWYVRFRILHRNSDYENQEESDIVWHSDMWNKWLTTHKWNIQHISLFFTNYFNEYLQWP